MDIWRDGLKYREMCNRSREEGTKESGNQGIRESREWIQGKHKQERINRGTVRR